MSLESDTRDRVIKLETEVQHLKDDLAELKKINTEMYEILLQAKGVKLISWFIFGGVGFLVSWIPTLINFLMNRGA